MASFIISPDMEQRVNDLIRRMTVEEKVGQLNQQSGFSEKDREALRLGQIGSLLNATDGIKLSGAPGATAEVLNVVQRFAVQGSRLGIPLLFGRDVIHGYRTIFPIPLAQAASWNPEMVERAATVAANEASSEGINWTFAPMLDLARDPRWGRVAEGSGEDPYLASVMATAQVKGYQGDNPAAPDRMLACAKHFVGYSAAMGGRDYDETEISPRALQDMYLPPFRAAINAGVATLMSAFSDLNGIPMTANRQLLNEMLRYEWGFKGLVVSDWGAVNELIAHGLVADRAEAAALALFAGVDMDMVSGAYLETLAHRIEDKVISVEQLEEAVRRVLRVKSLAGLFERPYVDPQRPKQVILCAEHRLAARRMAHESIVLLKNEKDILPLGDTFAKIALVGPLVHAQSELLGTWAPDGRAEDATALSQALSEIAPRGIELLTSDRADESVRLAGLCDAVVLVVGEHPGRSGENANVASLELPPGQRELVRAIANQGVPLILVVLAGRPLALTEEVRLAQAVVYAWHPGTEGGGAIADVLFGLADPGGRLPISMPRSTGQIPVFYNHKPSGRPAGHGEYLRRYVNSPNTPLFPFGYGLSYAQFAYSNLKISEPEMIGPNEISIGIVNVGSRPGTEVVQLYVRDQVASITRPVRELKGFQKVSLQPGEARRVTFTLTPGALAFCGPDERPRLEPGEFTVWVGPNSAEGVQGSFHLDI